MNGLVAMKRSAPPAGLEGKLEWLRGFGHPRLSTLNGTGWFCVIEMHVSAVGSTFKVESDHKCETPSAAVDQLIERMLSALAQMGGK